MDKIKEYLGEWWVNDKYICDRCGLETLLPYRFWRHINRYSKCEVKRSYLRIKRGTVIVTFD